MAEFKPDFEKQLDLRTLTFLAGRPNLGEYFTEEKLDEIGMVCQRGYAEDLASLTDWITEVEEIRKFAETPKEKKTYPWPGASNVRYPLILNSALQFNARAYPAIINMGTPVLAKVIGADEDGEKQRRADRISQHMSWQLTSEMSEWDEDMDRLLLTLPLDGCCFKKIYFDPSLGRNISQLVLATDLIVNANTMDLKTCPRISHRFSLYPYEVKERINRGTFIDVDYGLKEDDGDMKPLSFIEQHTYVDTDGDGYPEPYIITYAEDNGKVARIRANFIPENIETHEETGAIIKITPSKYFVKYECFPDPSGCFYGKGFGSILKPLNDSVDSILNQLIDAGHLANTGGGFLANSFRLTSGAIRFTPGKWEKVDTGGFPMKDAVMPLPVPDPSPVLFNLLGTLIEAAKEVGSTQDVMTGGSPGANTPATTTLAIIEQGMKVYTAIFKRIYRALGNELDLLFELNSAHVKDGVYKIVLDDERAIARDDYNVTDMDVTPSADPATATDIQKAAKAQVLMQFYGAPTSNDAVIQNDVLRSAGIADPDKYAAPPPEGPSPEEMKIMGELEIKNGQLEIKRAETLIKGLDTLATVLEKMSATDEAGSDNVLNFTELMLLFNELKGIMPHAPQSGIQQQAPVQEPRGLPAMEGSQPMAVDNMGSAG